MAVFVPWTAACVLLALIATTCLICSSSAEWDPGDGLTDFAVPTLEGQLKVKAGQAANLPLVAIAFDDDDAFSKHMWTSAASLTALLTKAPPSASFLFLSYSENTTKDALWMREQLLQQAAKLPLSRPEAALRMQRMHFATLGVPQLDATPLPALLANWTSPRKRLRASADPPPPSTSSQPQGKPASLLLPPSDALRGRGTDARGPSVTPSPWGGQRVAETAPQVAQSHVESTRLDAFYGWVPWPLAGVEGRLQWVGQDCDWRPADSASGLNGSVALITLTAFPQQHSGGLRGQGQGMGDGGDVERQRRSTSNTGSSSGAGLGAVSGRRPHTVAALTAAGLAKQRQRHCSYAAMLRRAEAAGVIAVVVAAPKGEDLCEMTCEGGEEEGAQCVGGEVGIPATMVPHSVGRQLRRLLRSSQGGVHVAFPEEQGPGLFAGIEPGARLFEVGWQKFPTLMHAVWAAQWQDYAIRLQQRLREPALVVPIFENQVMEGEHGVRVSVEVPDPRAILSSSRMELDMELGCPGTRDADCPIWDHAVQLFVCCGDPSGHLPDSCDPCTTTVWGLASTHGQGGNGSAPSGIAQHSSPGNTSPGNTSPSLHPSHSAHGWPAREGAGGAGAGTLRDEPALRCGRELGRWMTPFRRRIGRWLTDVSHLRPLLSSSHCTFTMQSTPWAGSWVPSLRLRLIPQPVPTASRPPAGAATGEHTSDASRLSLSTSQHAERAAELAAAPGATPRRLQGVPQQPPQRPLPNPDLRGATLLPPPPTTLPAPGAGLVLGLPPDPTQLRAHLLPLPFSGGTFDAAYNSRFPAFVFPTPAHLRQALVVALITGHGSDESGCAEFCPTSHTVEVNGARHVVEFGEAGTMWGCADKVLEGVEPNEHGTWFYGRNGWCDGQDVQPWVADVTADLAGAGGNNTVVYYGLYHGAAPQPRQQAGYIMMQAHLVLYSTPPMGGSSDGGNSSSAAAAA